MDWLHAHDVGIWNFFQGKRQPWMDPIIVTLSTVGNLWLLLLLFVLTSLIFQINRKTRIVTFLLACFAGGVLLTYGGQWLVGRERPNGVMGLLEEPGTAYAYPSEHVLLATVVYLSIAFVLADARPRFARLVGYLALALVFLVGLSRLFIGTCFPTDVIGGWFGGAAWVLLCRHVDQLLPVPSFSTPVEGS